MNANSQSGYADEPEEFATNVKLQLLSGLLLLIGRFVPLGLTILAAILFNILAFHILMAPAGFGPAVVATLLWAFLAWQHRESFAALLRP